MAKDNGGVMEMSKWDFRRARWDAYKKGVRDKCLGNPPKTVEEVGRFMRSYLEGYNETRPEKLRKYGKSS